MRLSWIIWGGPSVITRLLIQGRQEGQRVRRREDRSRHWNDGER